MPPFKPPNVDAATNNGINEPMTPSILSAKVCNLKQFIAFHIKTISVHSCARQKQMHYSSVEVPILITATEITIQTFTKFLMMAKRLKEISLSGFSTEISQ